MELKTLEQKGAYDDLFGYGEKVVRHVRTPAGVARFKQPIGSVIVGKGRKLDAIKEIDSEFIGWNKYKGKDKKDYYVGKEKGKYIVTTPSDEDLSSHNKEEEALDWLNTHAGGTSGDDDAPSTKKPAKGSSKGSGVTLTEMDLKRRGNRPGTTYDVRGEDGKSVAKLTKNQQGDRWLVRPATDSLTVGGRGPADAMQFHTRKDAVDHINEYGNAAWKTPSPKAVQTRMRKVDQERGRAINAAKGKKSAWDGLDLHHKSTSVYQTSLINKVNIAVEQKDAQSALVYARMLRNDARSNGMRDGGLVDVEKFIEGIG